MTLLAMGKQMQWKIIIFVLLNIVNCLAQGDVKICPPEPVPNPQAPCPSVCNRGCSNGFCEVFNPTSGRLVLPDTMPSRVFCSGSSCVGLDITCSTNASCDVIFSSDSGYGTAAVDCGNTTHSCNVFCDELSSLFDWRCNSNTSCNCVSNCIRSQRVLPGVDGLGDPCYRRSPARCRVGASSTMRPAIVGGNCSCECLDQSLTLFVEGTLYGCGRNESVCLDSSECGYPIRGRCNTAYPQQCQCTNPWGGPKCDEHMCPECQNSAFCSVSTTSPCICTGQWTGLYCNISKPISPSLPNNPEHVERCNATSYSGIPYFPPVQISPPCPSVCDVCSMDDDGTPACLIVLPRVSIAAQCPGTHRCVFITADYTYGAILCPGPYSCDLVTQYDALISFNCTSPVGCTTHCSDIRNSGLQRVAVYSSLICGAPNGSCSCSSNNCTGWVACQPGLTCNGDPCGAEPCISRVALYNETTSTCSCQCTDTDWEGEGGQCYSYGDSTCPSRCIHGVCHQGRCWCNIGYNGTDCSVRDERVELTALTMQTACPSQCEFCSFGSCIMLRLNQAVHRCPQGWACIFLCGDAACNDGGRDLICPFGSGPCEAWCWGVIANTQPSAFQFPGEFRPRSRCSTQRLICEDGAKGCQTRCADFALARGSSPYSQARTVRDIICNGTSANSTRTGLGPNDCGSTSCYIAESDTCYREGNYSEYLGFYGFVRTCPLDTSGRWLTPYVNSTTNTCECTCGEGYEFVNGSCSAIGCNPKCQNLGICQIVANTTHPNSTAFACKCFGGWNGRDCTSRCFFPVTANVTQCENGFYVIDGKLVVPANATVDLYRDIPDLQTLKVNGSVIANSTIAIGINNVTLVSSSPVVIVSGNWEQSPGTILQNSIVFDPSKGTFLATLLSIGGSAQFANSSLEISLNTNDIIRWLRERNSSSLPITLITFGNLTGGFSTISFKGTPGDSSCEKLSRTTEYRQGSLVVLFSLDRSGCGAPANAEAAGSTVNGVAIGLGIAAALVVVGAIAVVMFVPAVRSKVLPFSNVRPKQQQEEIEMNEAANTNQKREQRWTRSTPKPI